MDLYKLWIRLATGIWYWQGWYKMRTGLVDLMNEPMHLYEKVVGVGYVENVDWPGKWSPEELYPVQKA